jgi:hypothetical protein
MAIDLEICRNLKIGKGTFRVHQPKLQTISHQPSAIDAHLKAPAKPLHTAPKTPFSFALIQSFRICSEALIDRKLVQD